MLNLQTGTVRKVYEIYSLSRSQQIIYSRFALVARESASEVWRGARVPPRPPTGMAAMTLTRAKLLHAPLRSACLVGALGLPLTPDPVCGVDSGMVRLSWLRPSGGGDGDGLIAQLSPPHGAADDSYDLPFGHQGNTAECCCPVLADDELGGGCPPPAVRLGAVAVPFDARRNSVLLTRRTRDMRTFPRAWVLPGGSVDADDATVAHAAVRELREETGLRATIADCEEAPFCLWESAYPVTYAGWDAARRRQARVSHFLVAFFVVHVRAADTPIILSDDECDCACWVPLDEVADALASEAAGASEAAAASEAVGLRFVSAEDASQDVTTAAAAAAAAVAAPRLYAPTNGAAAAPIDAALLSGVYPNQSGEGIGRGHLWALRCLLHRVREENADVRPDGSSGGAEWSEPARTES